MVRFRSFLLPLVCLFASLPVLAAHHVWTGAADDRFSNAANWIGGSPAGDAAAELSFPTSGRVTATNDLSGLTVRSIAFSASGFTIGGNPMTLASGATVIDPTGGANTIACDLSLAGNVSVAVNGNIYDSKALTLSGAISGAGGITLRGGGHLVYAGTQPNTYTGKTRVLYGELQLKKPANVIAIAGDVEVDTTATIYEVGYLSIFNDEQIAPTAHVTISGLAHFGCAAKQTLGPLTLGRGAELLAATQWSGFIPLAGTVILAGDIELTGTGQNDAHLSGTFLLQGVRALHATYGYGTLNDLYGLGQTAPGGGLTISEDAGIDGTYFDAADLPKATYDGPTTIRSGNVRIDAPLSAVTLQGGRYSGHCKSLTATGGVLHLHNYLGGITSDGDVKLSPGATAGVEIGNVLKMNGALDLGGAALRIDQSTGYSYGSVYKLVDNASTKPVTGTFAGLPEGALVANRYRISYAGGDGNDVTLTDLILVPPTVSVTMSSPYQPIGTAFDITATLQAPGFTPTGTVTFSVNGTPLGTAAIANGVAKITGGATLPRGLYTVTAAYSGDARVAAATGTTTFYVVALKPEITSVTPSTLTGGVKTTLTIHGTNFVDGTSVFISSSGYITKYISPTELQLEYTPFRSESAYPLELWVSQPDAYGAQQSQHVTVNVAGVPLPPTPFTFAKNSVTLTGVTPGAMTLWLAAARGGASVFFLDTITSDTDLDGSVTLPWPFTQATVPPYGVWVVADLNAHTIVSDNPTRTAPDKSDFPPKVFLRDANGHYTHVQFPAHSAGTFLLAWARPGIGAWMTFFADSAGLDLDGGLNGLVTFDTSSMKPAIGTTAPPPAEGIVAGDMFMVVDFFGTDWWGDTVDSHLSESNGPGKLSFTDQSTQVSEDAGSAKVVVERTEGTDGTVTVQYATADDTAIAGRNYAAQSGTITFGPGEILHTITIPIVNDQSYSGALELEVTLTNPAGASLTGFKTHRVTINDDERPPTLSIVAPASVPEGDAGRFDVPVTVKLTGAPASVPVTVSWFWSEGSSSSPAAGQFEFKPGETEKTFTASYSGNTMPEPNRFLSLRLANAKNATAPETETKVTITDDDFAGVAIVDAAVTENAGKVVVPLQLSHASQKPVTVTYETRALTAGADLDYTSTTGTLVVGSGSSITIPIVDDKYSEPVEAFEIVLTAVSGGVLERSSAVVTVIDDDAGAPPPPPIVYRRTVRH